MVLVSSDYKGYFMDDAERNELAQAWIKHTHEPVEVAAESEHWWAYEKLDDIRWNDPDELWRMILLILSLDQSNTLMENLSAGPLEDLLAKYGPAFIDRVEEEARRNPKFAFLLGGVWQNTMSDEIWSRVQAVWNRKGWDGIPE